MNYSWKMVWMELSVFLNFYLIFKNFFAIPCGLSDLTSPTWATTVKRQIPNHWTAREFLATTLYSHIYQWIPSLFVCLGYKKKKNATMNMGTLISL